ncbi:hypothetical protein AALO_G00215690 [Alosa alosa]|uniref:Uncharacterized protein n=1 Tax=Alosa alosa TaxID=278164 RepID=A0AAV6G274_9TELE|nr:hypothetical protein AALO_G00215690 [Alosa alosa]
MSRDPYRDCWQCPCFAVGREGVVVGIISRQSTPPVPFPACVILFIGCHEEEQRLCLLLRLSPPPQNSRDTPGRPNPVDSVWASMQYQWLL